MLNLHRHKLDIYILENNNFNEFLKLDKNSIIEAINKNSTDLFSIVCETCQEIYKDYESTKYNAISVFCSKNSKNKYRLNNYTIFEFLEFGDYFLIGTKNDIISYIVQNYNIVLDKNDELNRNLQSKEKSIIEIQNKLNNARLENSVIRNQKNAFENLLKKKNYWFHNIN